MNTSWNPLFGSLLTSSLLAHGVDVLGVWALLLASADRYGHTDVTVPFLAERLKIGEDRVDAALVVLSSPDPRSRCKDHEGRRIVPMENGWLLVSHQAHRDRAKKEAHSIRQQRYMARKSTEDRIKAKDQTKRLSARLRKSKPLTPGCDGGCVNQDHHVHPCPLAGK